MQKNITLAMGNGGEENNTLIKEVFYKAFANEILEKNEDAAVLHVNGKIAMSTDSFTVSPLFFPGGDIGKLAICGTCNDLAMMGAKPKYITVGAIIEEGFSVKELQKIVRSMKKELQNNGAVVVSGDTKVMPRGSIDKIIINTSGVGEVVQEGISAGNLKEGDVILVSRDIGCHGATIFAAREGIELSSTLQSDCASLYEVVGALIDAKVELKALRDATRGGVAAVLNEWAKQNGVCIEVDEESIPVSQEVQGICELLGFEATALANEGTFLVVISKEEVEKALNILQKFNANATKLATVTKEYENKVVLKSSYGTKRFLDTTTGELLPRIC